MTQSEPKFIGKRISVRRSKDQLSIEITQQIERWQEAMLIAWLAAWSFCGVYFILYAIMAADTTQRVFFFLLTSAWLYFFVRITKVFIWRKIGKELITLTNGKLILKNAFGKRGKSEEFAYHNIFKLGLVKGDPTSFLNFLDDSFWIIGGDRVGFNYNGQKIRLGKQLSINDSELLVRVIESGMREYKKKPDSKS
jgi:hypothetical protein